MNQFLTTNMLDLTFDPIKDLTGSRFAHCSSMFSSYWAMSHATASRWRSSIPPDTLAKHYADRNNPRCPKQLHEDISIYAEEGWDKKNRLPLLNNLLLEIIDTMPVYDRDDLLVISPGNTTMLSIVSERWCRLTWYCICCDIDRASRIQVA